MNSSVRRELWTSWASLLRSYAAAHGLNAAQHAVVEVGPAEIIVRVGSRHVRCTPSEMLTENTSIAFSLMEDGTVRLGDGPAQEMDLVAEEITRTLLFP